MDIDSIGNYTQTAAAVIQALVVIITALVALWRWGKAQRAQGIRELIPAVVALVQDAKALSWSDKNRPLADVAGQVAANLQALARSRGLGDLTPAELEHARLLASAEHKALKLDAVGYSVGAPVPATAPKAAPQAAPGN